MAEAPGHFQNAQGSSVVPHSQHQLFRCKEGRDRTQLQHQSIILLQLAEEEVAKNGQQTSACLVTKFYNKQITHRH